MFHKTEDMYYAMMLVYLNMQTPINMRHSMNRLNRISACDHISQAWLTMGIASGAVRFTEVFWLQIAVVFGDFQGPLRSHPHTRTLHQQFLFGNVFLCVVGEVWGIFPWYVGKSLNTQRMSLFRTLTWVVPPWME